MKRMSFPARPRESGDPEQRAQSEQVVLDSRLRGNERMRMRYVMKTWEWLMSRPTIFSMRITMLAALISALIPPALAQNPPDFKGKTVTVIASFEAGGPYDFYSRLVARFLGAHLPGNPNVTVQNMPGAGGLRGANYLYNVAAHDGTVLGVVSQTVAVGQVLGTTPGIQYDARKYSWIGRINSNVEVQHTWHASGIRSIEDAKKREVVVAGTGPTSSSVVMPRLMNELIGTKFKVVT